jgi:hypothetical protein
VRAERKIVATVSRRCGALVRIGIILGMAGAILRRQNRGRSGEHAGCSLGVLALSGRTGCAGAFELAT